MKLKDILISNGVEKTLAEKIVNENKFYSQAQVDDIANAARETVSKKVESEYQAKISLLEKDYNNLQTQVRTKEIKETYIKNGGREEFFDDFIKLNGENLKDVTNIENAMYRSSWCFGEQKRQEVANSSNNIGPKPLSEKELDSLIQDLQNGKDIFTKEK